jgi:hypothetical protein
MELPGRIRSNRSRIQAPPHQALVAPTVLADIEYLSSCNFVPLTSVLRHESPYASVSSILCGLRIDSIDSSLLCAVKKCWVQKSLVEAQNNGYGDSLSSYFRILKHPKHDGCCGITDSLPFRKHYQNYMRLTRPSGDSQPQLVSTWSPGIRVF